MTKTYQLMDQFYKENNSQIKILIKEIIDAEPTLTEEYLYESIRIALKGNFTSSHPENFFSVGCKKNINIQVSERDYDKIQIKAVQEGIPYNALISMLVHKFAEGKLAINI